MNDMDKLAGGGEGTTGNGRANNGAPQQDAPKEAA